MRNALRPTRLPLAALAALAAVTLGACGDLTAPRTPGERLPAARDGQGTDAGMVNHGKMLPCGEGTKYPCV
jgi:hypothetical protein